MSSNSVSASKHCREKQFMNRTDNRPWLWFSQVNSQLYLHFRHHVSSGLEMYFLKTQKVSQDILQGTCFKGSPGQYKILKEPNNREVRLAQNT